MASWASNLLLSALFAKIHYSNILAAQKMIAEQLDSSVLAQT